MHVLNLIFDGQMFVFRLKSLNFFIITFLVALRTKTNECAKNESERARKPSVVLIFSIF